MMVLSAPMMRKRLPTEASRRSRGWIFMAPLEYRGSATVRSRRTVRIRVSVAHLAIVMPAYNEAEGIRGFIDEIREHVAPLAERVTFVVADDRSTDATVAALEGIADVQVHPQVANRGHGPTALAAYRAGLELSPDLIVHVDGDGQFVGPDFARVVSAIESTDADVIHGVRYSR